MGSVLFQQIEQMYVECPYTNTKRSEMQKEKQNAKKVNIRATALTKTKFVLSLKSKYKCNKSHQIIKNSEKVLIHTIVWKSSKGKLSFNNVPRNACMACLNRLTQ